MLDNTTGTNPQTGPATWRKVISWTLFAAALVQFCASLPNMWHFTKWDFAAYHYAATRIASGDVASLYKYPVMNAELRAKGYPQYLGPYLYPAPLAVALVPLTYVSFPTAKGIWFVALLLAAAGAYACLCRVLFRARDSLHQKLLLAAAFLGMRASQHDLSLGNCNLIVLFLVTLSMLSPGAHAGAQTALAAAAWIKLKPALLGVTYILNRQWKALILLIAAAGVISLICAAFIGFDPFVSYYRVTRGLAYGSIKIDNLSLYAVIGRLFRDSKSHVAPFHAPGLIAPLFRTGCLVIWAATAVSLWRMRTDRSFCYALLLTTVTITSPISWTPHFVLMLMPVAWLLSLWDASEDKEINEAFALRLLATAAVAILLIFPITIAKTYPVKGLFPVLLMSREFFGALLVWGVLLWTASTRYRPQTSTAL